MGEGVEVSEYDFIEKELKCWGGASRLVVDSFFKGMGYDEIIEKYGEQPDPHEAVIEFLMDAMYSAFERYDVEYYKKYPEKKKCSHVFNGGFKLEQAGIETFADLVNSSKESILSIKGIGKKAFEEIEKQMLRLGLVFNTKNLD